LCFKTRPSIRPVSHFGSLKPSRYSFSEED
jgi:hypothetical protein